jgi:soluble cytochrome b562
MRAAIGHLEAAKTAAKPLTSLQAARKSLVNAKSNKEGQRKDAIGYVDEAIAYATTGDKKTMLLKIDKAIANAKSGIARSK